MSIMIAEQADNELQRPELPARPTLAKMFCVGGWQVSPELNRLQHLTEGSIRQLEPRLINLLCYLAANSDRVISREELVQELWPRVIVNENSLTRAISELRKQLHTTEATITNYIETIPKRGYRLIPRVQSKQNETGTFTQNSKIFQNKFPKTLSKKTTWQYSCAVSAICLSLLIAGWFSPGTGNSLVKDSDAILLSDEILENKPDYLAGKLTLSTMSDSEAVVKSITSSVLSIDEKQYAFIQYDTTGSTIFLGGLGTAIEPVAVFYSHRHLFNLAWSPVGNNLLFAMKPLMTTAAVYSAISESETAGLHMLNLNTLEISRLIQDIKPTQTEPAKGLNLT